jgi:hypothetical protein
MKLIGALGRALMPGKDGVMPTTHFKSVIEYDDGKGQGFPEALQVAWGDRQDSYVTLIIHRPENNSHNATKILGEVHLTEFDLDELIDNLQRVQRYNRRVEVGDVIKAPSRKLRNLPVGSVVMSIDDYKKGVKYMRRDSCWEIPDAVKTGENREIYEDLPDNYRYVILEINHPKPGPAMQVNVEGDTTGPHIQAKVGDAIKRGQAIGRV